LGVTPRTLTAGGGDPLPLPTQAPRCWDPNLGPHQLFSRGCASGRDMSLNETKLNFVVIDQFIKSDA